MRACANKIEEEIQKREHYKLIFLSNMETSCLDYSCKIYDLNDVEDHLIKRGRVLDKDIDDELDPYPFLQEFRIKNAGSREDDVVILKLDKFSLEEMKILDVVRQCNAKCYIMMFVNDEEVLTNLKQYILKTPMFNVYLAGKSTNAPIYLIYRICAFCNGSEHQIEYYNVWKKGNGFKEEFKFLPSFTGNFNRADLKIGLKIEPPFTFMIGVTENGSPIYGGQSYWILEYLSKSANFNHVMVDQTEPPFYCNYGGSYGLYKGPCEMLANKEVDMAGFPDSHDYWQNHFFEPIGVYDIVHIRLISAKPRKEAKSQTTVKSTLLVSVAVAYISFVCILFLIEAVNGNRNINDYIWIMFEQRIF